MPVFSLMIDLTDKAMLILTEAAYFLAKVDIAMLKFESLMNFLESVVLQEIGVMN